jgi:hypothetical protein
MKAGPSRPSLYSTIVEANLPVWSRDGTKLFGFDTANGDRVIVCDPLGKTGSIVLKDPDEGSGQRLAK